MLCTATLSFIAISLAYFIVSIAGYNNLPSSLFLVGVVIIGSLIQIACFFVGEAFGWGAMVLMGVVLYLVVLFRGKAFKPDPEPSNGGGCGCCSRPRCGGCCPRPRPRPCPGPRPVCGAK
jgi:hypothetical protein